MLRITFILLCILFSGMMVQAQDLLISENFDDCSLPDGWVLTVENGQDAGAIFGYMLNSKSDSLTIDGSCMVIFDDDLLGDNQPSFRAELLSPTVNVAEYSNVDLTLDVAFRSYGSSSLEIFVVANGQYYSVTRFDEHNQTGSQMSQSVNLTTDLSFVVEADEIQIAVIYDDDEMYAWWGGIDNFKIEGEDKGESIVKEDFNSCELPPGWETEIIRGNHDWQIGLAENDKASAKSMNGSCFAYFDDDLIGEEVPYSTVELRTPVFDGSAFAEFELDFDLIFRKAVDFENISVYVFDGSSYYLVEDFIEETGGPHFNNYESISLDLTPYRSTEMQVVFRYEDGESWGWWTGVDNVRILGRGDVNDICSKAVPLIANGICQSLVNSNAVTNGPIASCHQEIIHTIWYSFQADRSGLLSLENRTDYNDVLTVYNGGCEALVEVKCANWDEHGFLGETTYLQVSEGQELTIRVAGAVGRYGKESGTNCLTAKWVPQLPAAAVLDLIAEAAPIMPDGECIAINSTNANTEELIPVENEFARSDVWLKFECSEDGNYELLSDVNFSESLTVYEIGETETVEVENSNFGKSILIENAMAGTTYAIQVAGLFATIEGSGCLKLEPKEIQAPENDDCSSAKSIEVGNLQTVMNIGNDFSGIFPTCNVYSNADAWLQFNTENHSDLYLSTTAEFPHVISVYEGECGDLEEVWCELSRDPCQGHFFITDLEQGEVYYIQVASDFTAKYLATGIINVSLQHELMELDPIGLTIDEECQDGSVAILNIIPFGGSGNYTLSGTPQGSELFAGEEYLVILTDNETGCEFAKKGNVACQPSSCMFSLEAVVVDNSCFGFEDGVVEFTTIQAAQPVSYLWNHPAVNGSSPENLAAGSYSVTATDGNLCVSVHEFVIKQPEQLTAEINSSDESAPNASDGYAEVIAGGGTFPYTFLWSNGSSDFSQSNLPAEMYSVTITDGLGCTTVRSVSINPYECQVEVAVDVVNVSCFDYADGSVNISNSSGTISEVVWSNGAMGEQIDQVPSGTYVATVTFSNGCDLVETVEVESPLSIEVETEVLQVTCAGQSDGSLTLLADGGAGDFSFTWVDGLGANSKAGLAAGIYEVTVTDANGCSISVEEVVTEPESLSVASTMVASASCFDSADGAICAFVSGGVEPYDFDWGDALPATSKIENLGRGIYQLTVYDENGCSLDTLVEVGSPSEIQIEVTELNPDVSGDGSGSATVSVSGGIGDYIVRWYLDGELVAEGLQANNLIDGMYQISVTDAQGCQSELELSLLYTSVHTEGNHQIIVFPNPTTDLLFLEFNDPRLSEIEIVITDVTGQTITKESILTNKRNRINVHNYTAGTYFIEMPQLPTVEALKFVVVR